MVDNTYTFTTETNSQEMEISVDEFPANINTQELLKFWEGDDIINPPPINNDVQLVNVNNFIEPIYEQHHWSKFPVLDEFDSDIDFNVELSSIQSGKNSWMYSQLLGKVFIKMSQTFTVDISYIPSSAPLFLRAMIVYSSPEDMHLPVSRCHNHENTPETNAELPHTALSHILRCTRLDTQYHGQKDGKLFGERLALLIPFRPTTLKPNETKVNENINFEFVCQNSCVTGINRRATTVIFTLEKENLEIVGKKLMNFKVCSCPKRDKEKEEKAIREKGAAILNGQPIPSGKRRMTDHNAKKSHKKPCVTIVKQEPESPPAEQRESGGSGAESSPTITTNGITLQIQLPDTESVQHVLRCALGEITQRMAIEQTEYLGHYAREIIKEIGKYKP